MELSTDRTFVHIINRRSNCSSRVLGLLARDSSQDSLQETSRERLLARDFLGRRRTQQPTRRRHTLNNQMITHGSMSFGAANECDARDKNKIAMIGTRRRSRRSRRGQDCEARDEDMITTLATRKRSRRSRRGQDCDARNEDKIATRNDRDEEKIATLATRTRLRRS
jgi:hypothetical protein